MSGDENVPVRCRREGRLGRITLDRPERLNALNLAMVRAIDRALDAWLEDPSVEVVVLDGAGDRGFCAGGDLRVIHDSALSDGADAVEFWREEYALDLRLARFAKPLVAVMDGIVMGGGLGLTVHADLRVVTERSVLAMPEAAIGLAPDVGASEFLGRIPGRLGTHIALTGTRLGPDEAVSVGLADLQVRSERLGALIGELQRLDLRTAAARYAVPPGPPTGQLHSSRWIEDTYDTSDAGELLERLTTRPEDSAHEAAATIRAASPTSVAVTLRALDEARRRPGLASCLERDYRMCRRFLGHPDLVEGTGSVVARTGPPRWRPAGIAAVAEREIDRFFAPLPDGEELVLPTTHRGQLSGYR